MKPEARQGGGVGGEDWGRGGWSIRKDNSETAALRGGEALVFYGSDTTSP